MKVLIYGAGVLGSVYAGHLHQAGNDVTVLARGERFVTLRKHGLILHDALTGELAYHFIPVTDIIEPTDNFDLVIVTVRKNQVASVLPELGNRNLGNVLFMVNNAAGYQQWIDAVGRDRLLVGFPGAGGAIEGDVVRYYILPGWLQAATLGELDSRTTPRLKEVIRVFRRAGFLVATCRNIDAWQKTHVAIVSPLANAIYMAKSCGKRLAEMPEAMGLAIRAVREGLAVLTALNIPITPSRLRIIHWLPQSLLTSMLSAWAKTEQFNTVAVRHAMVAADEMRILGEEFKDFASRTTVPTPAIGKLREFIPPTTSQQPRAAAA